MLTLTFRAPWFATRKRRLLFPTRSHHGSLHRPSQGTGYGPPRGCHRLLVQAIKQRLRVGAWESICRIRDVPCFIVYLAAASQKTKARNLWSLCPIAGRRALLEATAGTAATVCTGIPLVNAFTLNNTPRPLPQRSRRNREYFES